MVTVNGQYPEYFDGEDIEKLSAMKLAFLTKSEFGITRGAILDSARYGVWSYYHGDEKRYRGGLHVSGKLVSATRALVPFCKC